MSNDAWMRMTTLSDASYVLWYSIMSNDIWMWIILMTVAFYGGL